MMTCYMLILAKLQAGKKRVSSVIIIVASVVPVLVTALLVATGYYFRIRARKKHNAQIEQDNGEENFLN